MKFINYITALMLAIGIFACKSPAKNYKLTAKQKTRVHQQTVYQKNKIDKTNDQEKLDRIEKDKARLAHNRKVAASKDPAKKEAIKQNAKPFGF